MRRSSEEHLAQWFHKPERMPLIIRGARQVGKSTLVRLLCEKLKLDLIEINLENIRLTSLDQSDFKLQNILDEIQLKTKKILGPSSLLFLDEIQESPKLLKALRYFFEERPSLAVVAAGSLLELALKNEKFSFPVGRVEFYHLGPMSFMEFLWATNNELLASKLENLDFSPHVTELLSKELANYYYVGGMPRAVKVYVESNSLVPVRNIQNQILQTYMADFPKYNSRIEVRRIERIFAASVLHLGKKLIYQKLDPDSQSRDVKRIIELLIDARVILPCIHTNANSVPLLGESDHSIQKIYFLDIGLVNAMSNLDFDLINQQFKSHFNTKGILAEQFVAQHLAYLGNGSCSPQLFYWLKDKGSQKGEIDFIYSLKDKIFPIEVKSTTAGHLKSLFYFSKEKRSPLGIKISLEPHSCERIKHIIGDELIETKLLTLPLYAVLQIEKLIELTQKEEPKRGPKV